MCKRDKIFGWLDGIIEKGIPGEVEAIYINLVESSEIVEVELFGIGPFDRNDEDWACDYMFHSESVDIPRSDDTTWDWEEELQDVSSIIGDYVSSNSAARRLLYVNRIGVGFGDSEIVLVKDEI